jgi:hypothetical protein
MIREEARAAVIREWDLWVPKNLKPGQNAKGMDGMTFFVYLEREHPELLNFRGRGDKWQDVHGWLLRERRVSD